jgi:uncharacterized C2H2 Zn-finger protein
MKCEADGCTEINDIQFLLVRKSRHPQTKTKKEYFCPFHLRKRALQLELMKLANREGVASRDGIAWCPDCGDSLETQEIWRKDKEYVRVIDHHEYYCFGCDKTFLLVNKK